MENYTMGTREEQNAVSTEIAFQEFVLILIMVLAILGNTIVCYVVWKQNVIRKSTWHYLFSLSISDLAVALLDIPVVICATYDETILHNNALCQFNGFCLVFFLLTSLLTLAVISLHKFFNVRYTLYWRNSSLTMKFIAAIWIISFLVALGPALGWSSYRHVAGRKQCVPGEGKNTLDYIYLLALMILGFFLPLITMLFCYITAYFETKLHSKRLRHNAISDARLVSEAHVFKTILIVVITFCVCWSPFVVYTAIGLTKHDMPEKLPQVAFIFGFIQAAVNPVIYSLRHNLFRQGFKSIICCHTYGQHDVRGSTLAHRTPAVIRAPVLLSVLKEDSRSMPVKNDRNLNEVHQGTKYFDNFMFQVNNDDSVDGHM